jgi:23S rRNA (pseudouridine1915-N3)-methyltransferase
VKLQIVKIGRPAHGAYQDLVSVYAKRLKPIWKIEEVQLKAQSSQERSGKDVFQRLGWSADGKKLDPHHGVVVVDERGREFSSPELAAWLEKEMQAGLWKTLSLVIGGPYGLSDEVRRGADQVWSLSRAVFPSDLAWLMVWEQLYRASTIIRGTGYHHD